MRRDQVPGDQRAEPAGAAGDQHGARRGRAACGTVSTTLPTCRAWLMYRNASGARRTSHAVTGSGRSAPASNSARARRASRRCASGPGLAAGRRPGSARRDAPRRPPPGRGCRSCPSRGTGRRAAAAAARRRRTRRPASSSTTSTPRPPVAAGTARSNSRSRDDAMCSSSRPSPRSASHLPGLAVAEHLGAEVPGELHAAMPTPPAAACTSTRSPGCSAGEVDEPVVGGEERRAAPTPPARTTSPRGIRAEQPLVGDRHRAEGAGERCPSPGRPAARPVDAGADLERRRRRPRCRVGAVAGVHARARSARRGSSARRRAPRCAPARLAAARARPRRRHQGQVLEGARAA